MRTCMSLALSVWAAASLAAQDRPGRIMIVSADLSWNLAVQVTTVLTPPLNTPVIPNLEGGIKPDGDKIHRYIVDKANHAYYGYDLALVYERNYVGGAVRSPAGNRRHLVSIRPLSIVPAEAGFDGAVVQTPAGLARFANDQEIEDGDTIALDLLASLTGEQKAVDYIRISTKPDPGPADLTLVPHDFTVDDGPVSIKVPFQVFVNGKLFPFGVGWHIDRGSTMWIGLPNRGMYILLLTPRDGFTFQKAGAIRNHVIQFQDGEDRFEIRTSGPIAGLNKAWNLYVLHEPDMEMKGPLFGVDRLGSCTLGRFR